MKRFWIHNQSRYPVFLGYGLGSDELSQIFETREAVVVITDEQVAPLYADTVVQRLREVHKSVELIVMPSGETHKSRETKAWIEDQLCEIGAQRDVLLLALGGGVVLDIVGFVAATYRRGVNCCYWPTTLLSMVDASIGGKTALNTAYGKNLIGAFHEPTSIVIDLAMLESLPDSEWQAGLAEAIKHAFLMSEAAVGELVASAAMIEAKNATALESIIAENIKFKGRVVGHDPKEQGLRACLNFGHTFAHAIEVTHDYEISHGEAVLHGMWYEIQLGIMLGYTESSLLDLMQQCLSSFTLDLKPLSSSPDSWLSLMLQDKKSREQGIGFVFLSQAGTLAAEEVVTRVSKDIVLDKLSALKPLCR